MTYTDEKYTVHKTEPKSKVKTKPGHLVPREEKLKLNKSKCVHCGTEVERVYKKYITGFSCFNCKALRRKKRTIIQYNENKTISKR